MFFSNFVPKMHRFWDIRLVSIPWPWNPGKVSLKVIGSYTTRSSTYDFLLTFHSNHRPTSHRFRDKRRYPSKIARKLPIFPTHGVYRPRWRGSPWNFISAQGVPNASMMGLSDGRKRFKIGLVVLIQYRLLSCGRQPPTHPASHPDRHVAVANTLYASRRA